MTTQAIRVAIYARASSAEQTTSVKDQLAALRKEAKRRGFVIVEEYVDDGLSGSKEVEKRIAFHRMIADSSRRDFTRIFVYDTSRFGRLDIFDSGEFKAQLRRNGVQGLESLTEGFLDWHSQMGRIVDAINSENNHEAALKISRSVIRGRVAQLERKIYPHGQVPYGYDREYTADDGSIKLIARTKHFRKPKSWSRRLVVNEFESSIVRRIYDMFLRQGMSMRQIAKQLDLEHVPSWSGEGWSGDTVKKVLTSKAYIGFGVVSAHKRNSSAHNRMPAMEIPGVVPAILDEQTWNDAQRLVASGKSKTWKSTKTNRALGGILVCGKCGYKLVARQRRHRGRDGHGPVFYSCIGTLKRGQSSCQQYRVTEAEALPVIIRELVKATDAEIIKQLELTRKTAPANGPINHLVKEVEELREKLRKAALRAATADDELLEAMQEAAKTVKGNLTAAEERLRFAQTVEDDGGLSQWVGWWDETRGILVKMGADAAVDQFNQLQAQWDQELKRLGESLGVKAPKKIKPAEWRQWWESVRGDLLRVGADGKTSPALGILEVMEGKGTVTDSQTLRGVLRKLGCTATVWWVPNPDKRGRRNAVDYVMEKLKVEFACGPETPRARFSDDDRNCR